MKIEFYKKKVLVLCCWPCLDRSSLKSARLDLHFGGKFKNQIVSNLMLTSNACSMLRKFFLRSCWHVCDAFMSLISLGVGDTFNSSHSLSEFCLMLVSFRVSRHPGIALMSGSSVPLKAWNIFLASSVCRTN